VLVADSPDQTARAPLPHIIVVIPARYESSRLPGKVLAPIGRQPMVEHVYRRAATASSVAEVIVATDDARIARAVEDFGGTVRMTRATHASGTDRVAEVAAGLTCDLIVNVQGDEPLLESAMIEEAVAPFLTDSSLEMGSLRRVITDASDLVNPNVVKVIVDRHEFALYFSRAPIPYQRPHDGTEVQAFKHVGLYVYRREFLVRLAAMPATPLERSEMLEQLRALEHGYRIKVVETAFDSIGVDTPADLERVRRLLGAGARPFPTSDARAQDVALSPGHLDRATVSGH
jgi:3-deoxy-manno-octulosonate cytidylyltransferase (CMP-KDO synthetase)